MKKYLIGIDLDGTTLNAASEISTETLAYLKYVVKQGHKIVIATGRPYRGCREFYDALDLDTPLICDNGSSIYKANDPLFEPVYLKIKKSIIDKIFKFSKDHIETAFYSVEDQLFVFRPQERLSFLYHLNHNTLITETPFDKPGLPEPYGIMMAIRRPFDLPFESFLEFETEGLLTFRSWGKDMNNAVYEVYQKRASKGDAILHVASYLGIPRENIITFGDGLNDVELLKVAHHGVAMKNAVIETKEVSDAITEFDNHENGLIKYLDEYLKKDAS